MPKEIDPKLQSGASTDCPVILHISDLHFGKEEAESRKNSKSCGCIRILKSFIGNRLGSNGLKLLKEHRKRVLDSFIEKLVNLEPEWKPKYICVTGDIVQSGTKSEYAEAKEWLSTLLEALELKAEDSLIICPGNHDLDRVIADKYPRPKNVDEADNGFTYQLDKLTEKFANYEEFLRDMNIPQFSVSKGDGEGSYLYGVRDTNDGLKFICWNSCWYSRGIDEDGQEDNGMLWLGMPLIDAMLGNRLLFDNPEPTFHTIVLVHHPDRVLDDNESDTWRNDRPATLRCLAKMSNIMLCGHSHAIVPAWAQKGNSYISPIGSIYISLTYQNSFRLILIDEHKEEYRYRAFEWQSTTEGRRWQEIYPEDKQWRFFNEFLYTLREAMHSSPSMLSIVRKPKNIVTTPLSEPSDVSTVSVPTEASINEDFNEPSSAVNELDTHAQMIIDKLNQDERERRYKKALDWWDMDKDACQWFNDNQDKIAVTLAERITLIIEKIRLKAE